mgnify:CR=1 FL=1
MIDTDKYEGHTPAPWDGILSGYFTIEQLKGIDKTLMQDAPLLLEEVRRLRRVIHGVVVDLTVTNIGGPDGQGAAVKAALNTLSEVIDVD